MRDAPNLNHLWADLLVEELVRCGAGLFCLAPGSRSTPLAAAVAANPAARHLVHFDERGTAFAALGFARATGRPAVWITTSGTAVANGLPAVVEASTDAIPLILLTADRPPELRETGANQTVRQPGIFGEVVRWQFDLPAPTAEIDPAFVLTTVDQAVHRATTSPAGPVHLNAPFREPLAPDPDGRVLPEPPARWLGSAGPYTRYSAGTAADPEAVRGVAAELAGIERGLVVAGRLRTREEGEAALALAERLGWPLLPDIGSQIRLGNDNPLICSYFDLVLGSASFREEHRPEAVVYLGGRATSKRLAQHLAAAPDPFVVVRDDPFRFDPDHLVTHRVNAGVVEACQDLNAEVGGGGRGPSAWAASWRSASDAAASVLAERLEEEVSEPGVACTVSRQIPADHGLVLAASMPVRDADAFAVPDGAAALVASNRGASGIDGTVATAAGYARGLGAPATLLIGDLALLHDLNSLALLRDPQQPPLTVVAVNNDGGGIFHFLPVARHEEIFEPYFGTPHGLRFEHAARLFGLDYHHPDAASDFAEVYAAAVASGRSSLIEVTTEREENRALHAELLEAVAAAVDESVGAYCNTPLPQG